MPPMRLLGLNSVISRLPRTTPFLEQGTTGSTLVRVRVHAEAPLQTLADEAVRQGLLGREPTVPVGVLLDLLERLTGVGGDPLQEHLLHVEKLVGEDTDVGGRTPDAAGGLVHHDARVRQGVALA